MRMFAFLSAGLGLSACAAVPPPAPPPPPPKLNPSPPPPAPVARDWKDRPFTAGIWTLVQEPGGPAAQFGHQGAGAAFLIRCMSAAGRVSFSRAGSVPEGGAATMTLASTEAAKTFNAANANGVPAYIRSETSASDPHLDSLAFSRGRFLVSISGTEDLVVPSWPEFAHIVEECRSPGKVSVPASPQPFQSDAKIN